MGRGFSWYCLALAFADLLDSTVLLGFLALSNALQGYQDEDLVYFAVHEVSTVAVYPLLTPIQPASIQYVFKGLMAKDFGGVFTGCGQGRQTIASPDALLVFCSESNLFEQSPLMGALNSPMSCE